MATGFAAARSDRRAWSSVTRTIASTRRSRLRCIMSAEPIQNSSASVPGAPLPNRSTRECSRNRPRIDRTRMFSDSPGTPGTDPGEVLVRGANLFSGYWPDGRDGPRDDEPRPPTARWPRTDHPWPGGEPEPAAVQAGRRRRPWW